MRCDRFYFLLLFCLLNGGLPWLVVVGVVRCWRDWVVAMKGDSPGAVKGRSTQCPYRALDGVRCWPHRNFQFQLPPTSQTTKLKIKTKPRAPFLCQILPTTGGKKQQRKLREVVVVLSTVSVVPPDNNSVGRLSTFNSDYAHTHTHTNGERAWHAPFTGRRGQGQPERHTHTHTHCTSEKDTQQQSGQ